MIKGTIHVEDYDGYDFFEALAYRDNDYTVVASKYKLIENISNVLYEAAAAKQGKNPIIDSIDQEETLTLAEASEAVDKAIESWVWNQDDYLVLPGYIIEGESWQRVHEEDLL